MNIYQIDAKIEELLMRTDPETGELPEDAIDELTFLAEARDVKIENAACMVINLTAEAKAIREQEKALADRRQSIERRAERIKGYIEYATAGEPFTSPRVAVKYTKSQVVEIDDDFFEHAPDEYIRQKVEPDKTAIKAALKLGKVIPGAELVEKTNIQVK